MQSLNLNSHASRLADDMVHESASLRIGVSRGARGETLIDCGAKFPGGIEAGLRMARICMGGLGTVRLLPSAALPRWPWRIAVHTSQPVAACLASQYAGWALKHESGGRNFSALGSGPARALARREAIFADLPYREEADRAVLVLESEIAPPPAILGRSPAIAASRASGSRSSMRRSAASPEWCRWSPAWSRWRCTRRMP
jgi:methenyltetrahydromethanopterin cyclohydrolase